MLKIIDETVEFLKNKKFDSAEVGIILGTGLGKLIDEIEIIQEVSYNQIPNFPTATVEFHKGKLIYGIIEGKKTIVMQGRFHVYQGYSQQDVTYPIRIMSALGVKTLLVSNASGAINLKFKKSELMLIEDHINLQGGSPLAFKGVEQLGERFVDMSMPYDKEINGALIKIAKDKKIVLHKGVYASVYGPQLETKAEYRMLCIIGADAVGMSTVPEVIAARHMKIPCFGLSIITDLGVPGKIVKVTHQDVQNVASKAEKNLTRLIKKLLESI